MNAFRLWLAEWKDISKNKKMLISLIAILLVPVLYGGMFLWAFWDPYGKMDELPVAIVNSDTGADYDGTELKLGNDLVDNLKDEKSFNYQFVNSKKAYEGLENQDYYMIVEIPEDFSKNATTLLDKKPEKLELKYVPNETLNFLAAQIGETAVEKIKSAVSSEVSKTYAETIFDKVTQMADGFKSAGEGATKLDDGVASLGEGTEEIKKNLQTLAEKQTDLTNGASKLQAGADELADKTGELANGVSQLADGKNQLYEGVKDSQVGSDTLAKGISEFNSGLNQAEDSYTTIISGANELNGGLKTLKEQTSALDDNADKIASLQKGASNVSAGVAQLNQKLTALMATLPLTDEQKAEFSGQLQQLQEGSAAVAAGTQQLPGGEQLTALVNGISQLEEGSSKLSAGVQQFNDEGLAPLVQAGSALETGANQLVDGQSALLQGFNTFNTGFDKVQNGSVLLAEGASTLANGTNELENGSSQLAMGAAKLADGSEKLSSGTSELKEGSNELKDKLIDAADEAGSVNADDKTYDMMASPVGVEKNIVNGEVPNYGTGFAPYFVSLGMFVGALLLSIVFPMKEAVRKPNSAFGWFISKFGVIAVVGIIQALIVSAILLLGLKLEVQSVPLFILMTIVISLTYMAMVQFLVTTMGDPGRFVAILLLILQLTTSAGTFPKELIPDFLQAFNAWLPMTYSVLGFKAVISSGNFDFMWHNIGYLAIFAVIALAGTYSYFLYKYNKVKTNKWTERQQTV